MNNFTVDSLREFLNSHGVGTTIWGTGITKPIEKLLEEINEGEYELILNDNKIERVVNCCSIDIYYKTDDGEIWKLREKKQIMFSGEIKNPGEIKNLSHTESVRGKNKKNEDPEEAIKREMQEEIGVSVIGYEKLRFIETTNHEGMPTTFPGLFSRYTQNHFETYLHKEYFKPEGYIENQPYKKIYFEWEKL